MSEPSALDAVKAQAKLLLAHARAGDATVITSLREFLSRRAAGSDAEFARSVKLADVQHAVARKRGLASWADLKRQLEALDPIHFQAERFLKAVCDDEAARAEEILAATPPLRSYSAQTAAAACDSGALKALLDADSTRATRPLTPAGREPIVYACGTPLAGGSDERRTASARCVELLLQRGASANASIPWGDDGARLPALYFASVSNNVGAVRLLLAHGANPDDGESIFHSAERDYHDVMQRLVDAGCDISHRDDKWDNSPLYFLAGHTPSSALCESSERGMIWLLEHGADPNVPTYINEKHQSLAQSGERPLHRIAELGKGVRMARALLAHGADIDATRRDGKTAYVLALRTGNVAVAEFLLSVGASTSALTPVDRLLGACAVADARVAHELVAANPGIMATLDANDRRAITLAAKEGKEDSVRLMVALGFSLTEELDWGGTPLHQAAWHGRVAMTKLLIELGAPINARDKQFGSSPLAWAAHGSMNGRRGHDEEYCAIVALLLDAGSTREPSYNKWNEAPESMASKAVAKLLRQRGFGA
jgi:ankyrin repeat protein